MSRYYRRFSLVTRRDQLTQTTQSTTQLTLTQLINHPKKPPCNQHQFSSNKPSLSPTWIQPNINPTQTSHQLEPNQSPKRREPPRHVVAPPSLPWPSPLPYACGWDQLGLDDDSLWLGKPPYADQIVYQTAISPPHDHKQLGKQEWQLLMVH